MSTVLEWAPPASGHRYSVHASGFSVCCVWVAGRWTFECWKGGEQLKVGLRSWSEAKAWCQRQHDKGHNDVDSEQTSLLAGP